MFSVVIPTLNNPQIISCIQSIKKAGKELVDEIIVVNNGNNQLPGMTADILSTPGVIPRKQILKQAQNDPHSLKLRKGKAIQILKLVQNDKNVGYAKAVNQGIIHAKNEWVAVLNDDVILDKCWFQEIQRNLQHPVLKYKTTPGVVKTGSICGTVLNKDGTKIESTGLVFYPGGRCVNRDNNKIFNSQFSIFKKKPKIVFGGNGAVIIYNKKLFIKAGMFDEDFFAYEEDVDLSLRMNNLGYKCLYIPKAIAYHQGGFTSSKFKNLREINDIRNWWFIIIKNYSLTNIYQYLPQIILERLKNIKALFISATINEFIIGLLMAYIQVLIKLPTLLTRRKVVKLPL